MITTTLAFITFVTYLICSLGVNKWEIPNSLSETFYIWKDIDTKLRLLFPVSMCLTAATLWIGWVEIMPINWQWSAFVSVAGLIFVAFAPNFKDGGTEGKTHISSAIVSAVAAIIACVALSLWHLPILFGVMAICLYRDLKGGLTFWLEMAAFASIFAANFISYL